MGEEKRKAPSHADSRQTGQHEQGTVRNTHSDTRSRDEAARINRAIETAHEADAWVAEHPDAWRYVVRLCLNEGAHNRTVSLQWAAEQLRKRDFASFPTPNATINNRFRAPLARRLVREHPELKPFIELRKSALDLIGEVGADA